MNKSVIYISFFFVLFGLLSFFKAWYDNLDVVLNKDGLQFTKIEKEAIYSHAQKDDVFIIKDPAAQETYTYRFASYPSTYSQGLILRHKCKTDKIPDDILITGAINGKIEMMDSLLLYPAELKQLLIQAEDVNVLRLIQYNDEPFLWKVIDSILLVFLVFLVGLWIYEGLVYLFKKLFKKEGRNLVRFGFLLLILIFLHWGFAAPWEVSVSGLKFLWVLMIVLPVFFIFQYALNNRLRNKDVPDQEMIKFTILFAGSFLTFILASYFVNWIDNALVNTTSSSNKLLVTWPFVLAIPFFFATANLLNNLIKQAVQYRNKDKALKDSQEQTLASQAELNALQASVNPHFLYNSLNSIASLAQIDPAKTEKMALALSAFYKYTTNRKDEHLCKLQEELELIQTYLDIEKIRFGDRLIYSIDCSDEAANFKIPRFLLQPIVENAIKYGYNEKLDKIKIKVEAALKQNTLELKISDEGQPFNEEMNSGYGLKSIIKKLKLLHPMQHYISFINEPQKHVLITIKAKR